jgi:hypothetical protein
MKCSAPRTYLFLNPPLGKGGRGIFKYIKSLLTSLFEKGGIEPLKAVGCALRTTDRQN